jgi:hypothetical protein
MGVADDAGPTWQGGAADYPFPCGSPNGQLSGGSPPGEWIQALAATHPPSWQHNGPVVDASVCPMCAPEHHDHDQDARNAPRVARNPAPYLAQPSGREVSAAAFGQLCTVRGPVCSLLTDSLIWLIALVTHGSRAQPSADFRGGAGTRATQIIDADDDSIVSMEPKVPTALIRTRYVFQSPSRPRCEPLLTSIALSGQAPMRDSLTQHVDKV